MKDEVYVYGSNLAARFVSESQHAALRWYNADLGIREGMSGDTYAIPVWDRELRPLPMAAIAANVARFLALAASTPHTEYYVPRFTLGESDIAERDIARCFANAPANCHLPGIWQRCTRSALVKLFLVAGWAGLSETNYGLFYVWLHKYAKCLLAVPDLGGVWCVADARAQLRIGTWARKEGVPFHILDQDRSRYGAHAITILHERLLTECTDILAMESASNYVKAVLTRASHLGLGARLVHKYATPRVGRQSAVSKPVPAPVNTRLNPLRQPAPEDLQVYDPAGVYGMAAGHKPQPVARKRSEAEDSPFGRILDYVPCASA